MGKIVDIIFIAAFFMLFLILSIYENRFSRKSGIRIIFSGAVVLVIFASIRDIGLDLEPYREIFDSAPIIDVRSDFLSGMFVSRVEPFHALLISGIKKMGLSFKVFLFVCAAIPFGIISTLISKECNRPILTFLLFNLMFLFTALDVIRHFVAVSIYLSALYSLSTKRVAVFSLKSFASFFMHYSNAALLFVSPFLMIKWKIKKYIIALLLSIVLGFIGSAFIKVILLELSDGSSSALIFKLNYYVNNTDRYEYTGELHYWLLGFRVYFSVVLIIVVNIVALAFRSEIQSNSFHKCILNSQVIGSILSVFLIAMGARDFAVRVNFLMSIGSFLILKDIVLIRPLSNRIEIYNLVFVLGLLAAYNYIVLLYLAGIHQPQSPFYLGY